MTPKHAVSLLDQGLLFLGFCAASFLAMPSVGQAEIKTHLNLGVEGGFSADHHQPAYGGHISLRASLVRVDWNRFTTDPFEVPTDWLGGYLRLEQNVQDRRAVLGIGSSLDSAVIGLEGGVLLRQLDDGAIDPGAELAAVFTVGPMGIYIRESYVHQDDAIWQTDVGLRLMLPMWPGLMEMLQKQN